MGFYLVNGPVSERESKCPLNNRLVSPLVLTLFASDISSENKTADGRGRTTDRKEEIEGERERKLRLGFRPSFRRFGKGEGTEKYQCVARSHIPFPTATG